MEAPNPDGTNKALLTLVISILASQIISQFELGQAYYGLVYEALKNSWEMIHNYDYSYFINHLENLNIDSTIILYLSVILSSGAIIYFYWKKVYYYFYPKVDEKYITAIIYNLSVVRDISTYMRLCPEYFKNLYSFQLGDPKLISKMALNQKLGSSYEFNTAAYARSPTEDEPIEIKDEKFGVEGVITWKVHLEKVNTKSGDKNIEEEFPLRYVEIKIKSECDIEIEDYIEKIKDYNEETQSKEISRYHCKILTDPASFDTTNDLQLMYSGPIPDMIEREKQFIRTFFHHRRDPLWELIKKIQLNPDFFYDLGQAPRIGLLLHGPPGTGKSSFAYRVAMALNRHIVSVDIRTVRYKSKLWQIIKRPRIQNQQNSKDCVFIFDEFDLTVRDLYYRDKYNKGVIKHWIKKMDTKTSKEMPIEPEEDNKSQGSTESRKKKKKHVKNFPSLEINHEEIQLNDLLEVFQGPVPIDGLIAIATTNYYDEIKKMCPPLFRAGRLTPVYFGYASRHIIKEMSYFYFKKIPKMKIPNETNIPTSQMIEIIQEAKVYPDKEFEVYCELLEELLTEK